MLLCKYCNKECKNDNSLRNHERLCKHNPDRNAEYLSEKDECSCDICGKLFNTKQGLRGHKQRSHLNKDLQRNYGLEGNAAKREMEKNGHKFTFSMPESAKEKLSIAACARLAKHSKYTRNIEYRPGIILESSYEVRVAEILDLLNIKWEKVRRGYCWDDNGKKRRYIPDFYLPQHDLFLDPKNDYLITKDKRKIDSAMEINNIKVVILSNAQINIEYIKQLVL